MDRDKSFTAGNARVEQRKGDLLARRVQYCFAAYVDVHCIRRHPASCYDGPLTTDS